jgi:hypothetical protein
VSNTTRYILKVLNTDKNLVRKTLVKLLNDDDELDINTIMPTPEDLIFDENDINLEIKEILNGLYKSPSDLMMAAFKIKDKEHQKRARNYIDRAIRDNQRKYGDEDIHSWRYKNWGFYNQPIMNRPFDITVDESLWFECNYVMKEDIWIEMSKLFPEVNFEIKYANERLGLNCGIMTILNGVVNHIEKSPSYLDDLREQSQHFNKLSSNIFYPNETPREIGCFDEEWNVIEG